MELWQFVASRLEKSEAVMLLVVATSSGSSPGRAGYKMAVGADGELVGSIGGGVMEVNLVEQSRVALSEPGAVATGFRNPIMIEQVHQKNSPDSSGMICSGKQTVIFRLLNLRDSTNVAAIIKALKDRSSAFLLITSKELRVLPPEGGTQNENFHFDKWSGVEFNYRERLGPKNELYVVGGGHCALALSELFSRMDFRISIFDDRPGLSTIRKNEFAAEITIIDSYDGIGAMIPQGPDKYVVVMTLGYKSDEVVIRELFDHEFKYFGVLGSKAKMKTLFTLLEKEGFSRVRLAKIHTPIGLPINSRTPEEIAVSIAAEIIAVKNSR